MIRYDYTIKQEDLDTMVELALDTPRNVTQRKFRVKVGYAAAVLVAAMGLMDLHYLPIFLAGALICLIVPRFVVKPLQRHSLKEDQRSMSRRHRELVTGDWSYLFDENKIKIRHAGGEEAEMDWEEFKNWGEIGHYVYLRRKDNAVLIVDKRQVGQDWLDQLMEFISANRLPRKED